MTLVLGARCSDGVSIIADRKITDVMGTLIEYKEKLCLELTNIIFGFAGNKSMKKLFEIYVLGDVTALRGDPIEKYTDQNLLEKLQHIISFFKEIRGNTDPPLSLMVGRILSPLSDLHTIDCKGRLDYEFYRQWKAIGSGENDANRLIENEWESMTMKEFSSLSYSVIKYIEEKKPNGTVGTGNSRPDIAYLKNAAPPNTVPTSGDWLDFENAYPEYRAKFEKSILLDD